MAKLMLMASEERAIEAGNLVSEYTESKSRLAALLNEMDRTRTTFREISAHLENSHATAFVNARGSKALPTQDRFDQLALEIKQEFENNERLGERMKAMGVDVKEAKAFPFKTGKYAD